MNKTVFFSGGIDRAGGTERVLCLVASGLAKKGFDVTIVSMCGEKRSHYPLDERIKTIYMEAEGFSKKIRKNIKDLSEIMETEKPDYWVDVDIILGLYTYFARKKHREIKWIGWEHFNFFYNFMYYKTLRKIARKIVCKKADALVVLSEEDREYYRKNTKIGNRVYTIYNPSPFEIYDNYENREKTVISIGRLTYLKGYDMLLKAWKKVSEGREDWKLVIAGDGEEKDSLNDLIKNENIKNVEMTGFVDEIGQLYEKASLYVLPSRNEGFPMVILEAMSYGLPCVAFGCKAGVGELIVDNKTGLVAENENIDDLAEKMGILMDNQAKREEMSRAANIYVRNFDSKEICEKWSAFLHEIGQSRDNTK